MEIKIVRPDEVKKSALTHERRKLDLTGELAQHLLAIFAHTGIPDGFTSSGKQMLRPLEPSEIVERAVTTAELAMVAFEARGWVGHLPPLAELLADDASPAGFRSEE